MKKIFLSIITVYLVGFYCHSSIEASAEESEASISFYEEADTSVDIIEDENDKNYSTNPETGDYTVWKPILLGGTISLIVLLLSIVEKKKVNKYLNIDTN